MNSLEAYRPGFGIRQGSSTKSEKAIAAHPTVAPTQNLFAPLRVMEVDTCTTAGHGAESEPPYQAKAETSTQRGRKATSNHSDHFGHNDWRMVAREVADY
jgi:hypothetical protein